MTNIRSSISSVDGGESCNYPSYTLNITVPPNGKDSNIEYDGSFSTFESDQCIPLIFQKKAPNQEFSFVIDSTNGFTRFRIELKNNTEGSTGNGTEKISINPRSSAMDLQFYGDI